MHACGDHLGAKTIHMCSYTGPREEYHDDFDKRLDGPYGGWSDMGFRLHSINIIPHQPIGRESENSYKVRSKSVDLSLLNCQTYQ
jgi:hypothetical protein